MCDRSSQLPDRHDSHHSCKFRLSVAQFFLCPLPIVDIGCENIPAVGPAFGVSHRAAAAQEPLIFAIGAADTVLEVDGLSSFNRSRKGRNHYWQVVRMNSAVAGPTLYFLDGHVEICQKKVRFPLTSRTMRKPFRIAALSGMFRWGFPLTPSQPV